MGGQGTLDIIFKVADSAGRYIFVLLLPTLPCLELGIMTRAAVAILWPEGNVSLKASDKDQ